MRRVASGFTLIELVTVLVLLGIMSALGSQFIVTTVDSYRDSQNRSRLLAKSRTSVEQMTRYIRSAVPNSLRISPSGNCVEFLPAVGGAFYSGEVPDMQNGAALISSVATSPATISLGSADHLLIGAMSSAEIYANTSPASRVDVSATSGTPVTSVTFSLPHRFVRNSINSRVFLAADPIRFCVVAGSIILYEGYGLLTSTLSDVSPGGDSVIMATDVSADGTAFVLSPGTEDRNTLLQLALTFIEGSSRVTFNQQILVRNVP